MAENWAGSRGSISLDNGVDHSSSFIDPSLGAVDQSLQERSNQFINTSMIEELGNDEWAQPATSPDQSWWFDYNFDPNSLDMSLFEPMAFSEPFSSHTLSEDSLLAPFDRTLPGLDTQKAWFTYIDRYRSPGTHIPHLSTIVNNNEGYELDEDYRLRACQILKNDLHVDPLPSTGLLVSSTAFQTTYRFQSMKSC